MGGLYNCTSLRAGEMKAECEIVNDKAGTEHGSRTLTAIVGSNSGRAAGNCQQSKLNFRGVAGEILYILHKPTL